MIVPLIKLKSQSNRKDWVLVMYFHYHGTMMHLSIVYRISNFYYTNCPFNACMLATSAGSLVSLSLDPNNVILANFF